MSLYKELAPNLGPFFIVSNCYRSGILIDQQCLCYELLKSDSGLAALRVGLKMAHANGPVVD
jgi:hypothetical protein